MKFEVSWWWEQQIWIPLWIDNYEVRIWFYRYFVWMLIDPFLNKFGFDSYDSSWNDSFDEFQWLVLRCNENSQKEFLEKNWFDIVWIKIINFKIVKKWNKDTLDKYSETWDDFDMKQYLEKAKNWELSFWFIPWDNNWYAIIFAKPKMQEIEFFTLERLANIKTSKKVEDLLNAIPTESELSEASKPWWLLHWLTI